jgi:hypothetical protein
MFLAQDAVAEARRRNTRYRQFKDLCFELVDAYVQLARSEGLNKR